MSSPLRLFLTAGEVSGDRIGAELVRSLTQRTPVDLSGVGGSELGSLGLVSLFPMSDLSVMGFADVVARFPLLWWRMRQTVASLVAAAPDVAVLIDSQVFSATVAKQAHARGYKGKILLYVAPSVWAWKPERAKELRSLFNEVLCVLPFEPEAMQKLGGPLASYVGHPALKQVSFRESVPERGPLLLLPGSRGGELRRHLPLMERVAAAFADHSRVTLLVLPTPPGQLADVASAVGSWKTRVAVVASEADKVMAFASAIGAAAVSGTVTLELALAGVPMCVTYVADSRQHRYWVGAGRPRVALPNIVLDQDVVPEAVWTEGQPNDLIERLKTLLDNPATAAAQLAGFRSLRVAMGQGVIDPAERVLDYAGQRFSTGT